MAHVQIDDTAPSITYVVGSTPQTAFVIPYTFFAPSDIEVYVDDELKILSTDYTVEGTAGFSKGFPGGTVTMLAPMTDATVKLVRNVPLERTTDFPNSGPFQTEEMNTQLDKIIAIIQQVELRRSEGQAGLDDAVALASVSAAAAAAALVALRAINYGPLAADPVTRPDGSPIQDGDTYTRITNAPLGLRFYSEGQWKATFGDMLIAQYDPQGIGGDPFARANHTGEQAASTITGLTDVLNGLGDLSTKDKAAVGDIDATGTPGAVSALFGDGSWKDLGDRLVRAWVNFNGVGTVAIRDSYNVSSITDNGGGDYTVNYANALPSTNYAIVGCTNAQTTTNPDLHVRLHGTTSVGATLKSTTQTRIIAGTSSPALTDVADISIIVVGG